MVSLINSHKVTYAAGRPVAFIIAFGFILIWVISGPLFDYSDTWQLIINTSTTIVTFLMVFIIQHSQNKDISALQIKLDELLSATEGSDGMINIEELDDEDLEALKAFFKNLKDGKEKHLKTISTEERILIGKKAKDDGK